MPNGDPECRIFLSTPNNHDKFFFLLIVWYPAFDFKKEVVINESHSYTVKTGTLYKRFKVEIGHTEILIESYI